MKLIEKNISAVIEHRTDKGIAYSYYVISKSGRISDNRNFINYNEKGRTTADEYKMEWLPKAVQNFIKKHEAEEPKEVADGFTAVMYR